MTVVYVAGAMRSGTTIVGQMLAASPDTVLVGEVRPVLLEPDAHQHCDCGRVRDECPFWAQVFSRVAQPSPEQARAAYRVTLIPRLALALVLRRPAPSAARPVVDLLRAVAEVAGERTVIDTSKTPTGILLWRLARSRVDVVQALRDPREVARAQARPTAESGLARQPHVLSWAVWAAYNGGSYLLRSFARAYTVAAYETVRNAPRTVAERAWRTSSLAPDQSPAERGRFETAESHVLAGNPRRARGTLVIRPMSPERGTDGPMPDFVILGAQKAGSTALMHALGAHPQVLLPQGETRYFRDPWFGFQDETELAAAVRTDDPGVLARGIKCPDLLCNDDYAGRVVTVLPDAKLVAVLREPVSRAVSSYHWLMQWGLLPVEDIETGLPRILAGELDEEWPRAREVLEFGRYGAHLQHWLTLVPRERLCVLLDRDFFDDPSATLRRIYGFLGVSGDVEVDGGPARAANAGVYSQPRLQFLRLRHRLILRPIPGHEGRYLQPPANPATWVADRTLAAVDRVVLSRVFDNSRPSLSPGLRARLADLYRDDVTLTESLIGRDLSAWRSEAFEPRGR